jgi:SAM-dependent methyltransferase
MLMTVRRRAENIVNSLLDRCGYHVARSGKLYDFQKTSYSAPRYQEASLPDGAESYLQWNNERLQTLQQRYRTCSRNEAAVWTDDMLMADDLRYFRGDNAYVWQLRGRNMGEICYALAAYYVEAIDSLGLLDRLVEDDYFGNFTFSINGRIVSRDLLDSIIEIYFLERHLNISQSGSTSVLDIGAGYGRLAHRMVAAYPNIEQYVCTDAYAASTFISEYYLRFRGLQQKARVVPFDEIERAIESMKIDVALNIHSFSECGTDDIEWWLALLEKNSVRHLMVVPNSLHKGGRHLLTNDGRDFQSIIERHGYKLTAKEPKFRDPLVQKYAINPTYHYLFELG